MSDDSNEFSDPFRRRDTRSFLGKSERRESPRAPVSAVVTVGDEKTETAASVSLNGVFVENKDCDGAASAWIGRETEIELHLQRDGEALEVVQVSGTFERPHHRDDGALIRFSDLSFESERSLARFLDETSRSE